MAPGRRLVPVFLAILAVLTQAACDEVKARRRIQEGNKLYYDNKYEMAIVEYEAALAAKPELYVGWYNLGLAHIAMFSPGVSKPENLAHANGAIKGFSKYLEYQPEDTKARDYLLSTYIDSQQPDGAIAYFQKQLDQ